MHFSKLIAIMWLTLIAAIAPAHAEKRVALVIGNNRYANLPANEQLQKAVNDARAVGGALTQVGFEVVSGENLGRRGMLARLDEAAQRVAPGDTVFFFFSGHGVAVNNTNYILPADVPAVGSGQTASLTGATVREGDIIDRFQTAGARVVVVVLDACRNNPFVGSGTKGIGGEKGLAPREPPSGVFTFYAASRGEAALDRLCDGDRNPNSVFTRVLLPALARSDLDLPALAREVREEVTRLAESVGHAQRPAYYDETRGGRIFLAPAGPAVAASSASTPVVAALSDAQTAASAAVTAAKPAVPQQQMAVVPPPPPWPVPERPKPMTGPQMAAVAPPVTPVVPAAGPCSGVTKVSLAASRRAAPLSAAEICGLRPKDSFRECENCPEMVVVPAGAFTMGSPVGEKDRSPDLSEGPQHVVTIGKAFAVGKWHVTIDQFAAFLEEMGWASTKLKEHCRFQAGCPEVRATWDDANAYADWLAKKTGKPYRLLSEAEWEYAARGQTSPGSYPRFWFGNNERDLCRYGNGDTKIICDDGYDYTSPVGHYEPNAFGLYDMFGNAWQWTADCWHDDYNGAPTDGSAWITNCSWGLGSGRVVRGGSWSNLPFDLRAAARYMDTDTRVHRIIGFRVARTLTP